MSFSIIWGESEAGPMVQTILVKRLSRDIRIPPSDPIFYLIITLSQPFADEHPKKFLSLLPWSYQLAVTLSPQPPWQQKGAAIAEIRGQSDFSRKNRRRPLLSTIAHLSHGLIKIHT
jgi:hypothetical protein